MPNSDKLIETCYHHQIGWLRRPELDESFEGYFVYEQPDGDLVISEDPRHKHRALINVWKDSKTGEKYATFSKIPFPTGRSRPTQILPPTPKSQP